MNIEEIHTSLKERYPNLTFNLFRNHYGDMPRILGNIYNKEMGIRFEIMFMYDGAYLTMCLCFGQIKSNYETMFFLNKLNITIPNCFKIVIERVNGLNKDYLIARYIQPVSYAEQVPNIFINATNLLFKNTEFKILYKYVENSELKKKMN